MVHQRGDGGLNRGTVAEVARHGPTQTAAPRRSRTPRQEGHPEGHGGSARMTREQTGSVCACGALAEGSHSRWVESCPSKQYLRVLVPRICERGLIWKESLQASLRVS